MTATSDGCVVTRPRGIGNGRSEYDAPAWSAGAKATRGVVAMAARTRSSLTPAACAAKTRSPDDTCISQPRDRTVARCPADSLPPDQVCCETFLGGRATLEAVPSEAGSTLGQTW